MQINITKGKTEIRKRKTTQIKSINDWCKTQFLLFDVHFVDWSCKISLSIRERWKQNSWIREEYEKMETKNKRKTKILKIVKLTFYIMFW